MRLRQVARGVALSLVGLAVLLVFTGQDVADKFILAQALPGIDTGATMRELFSIRGITVEPPFAPARPGDIEVAGGYLEQRVLGPGDIIFLQDDHHSGGAGVILGDEFAHTNIEALRNFELLQRTFYTVAPRTRMTPELFDVDRFMAEDLHISTTGDEPRILIFHVHTTHMFADSRDFSEGIVAVGAHMQQVLERRHGIPTMHVYESFDIVDGHTHIMGSYERMEPRMRQILEENPSIEVVIDIHRDGVPEHMHLLTEIDGRPTAQIMFFNGLSMMYENGELRDILHLPNPYLAQNLALSFRLQLAANTMHPGFTRRIFLNAFRYSLHMRPKSILLEVGAQTNTLQEALNAVEPFTDILASVILPPPDAEGGDTYASP